MRNLSGKRYWIVGASEGLGRSLAKKLDAAGCELVVSARSKDRLDSLVSELKNEAISIPLDVTDSDTIEYTCNNLDQVDGVIYVAGTYEPMNAREWDAQKANTIAEINFMGGLRVLGAITPKFVNRDEGHIVIIGSLSGYRGLPNALAYGASKAGLMHLAETMRSDLWKTNVDVQLFNPGFIRTRLTDKNTFKMPFLMTTDEAAEIVVSGMKSNRFKNDFPFLFSSVFRLSRLLPQSIYQRIFAN